MFLLFLLYPPQYKLRGVRSAHALCTAGFQRMPTPHDGFIEDASVLFFHMVEPTGRSDHLLEVFQTRERRSEMENDNKDKVRT